MKRLHARLVIVLTLLTFQTSAYSDEMPVSKTHLERVPLEVSHADAFVPKVLKVKSGNKAALLGKVESNEIAALSALNEELGFKSSFKKSSMFPARIMEVFPNSLVGDLGLTVGDRLVSECTVGDKTTLVVEHRGQGMRLTISKTQINDYLEQLHAKNAASALEGKVAVSSCPQKLGYEQAMKKMLKGYGLSAPLSVNLNNSVLNASLQARKVKQSIEPNIPTQMQARGIQDIFSNHDLAIIVDRSGSMSTKDCPGGLSRWQWCSIQASSLAQAAAKASSSINVMFFNSQLDIFENIDPQGLPALFNSYAPSGGTVLAAPLVAQLDRYFANRKKPLIIVVITDGLPQDWNDLSAIMLDASDSLHYVGEVTISFLLIGNQVDAPQLRAWVGEREGGSIDKGGMVDVISFKETAKKGIKEVLFEELKTISSVTNRSHPSTAVAFATGKSMTPTMQTNRIPSAYYSSALTNPFPVKWVRSGLQ